MKNKSKESFKFWMMLAYGTSKGFSLMIGIYLIAIGVGKYPVLDKLAILFGVALLILRDIAIEWVRYN